MKLVSSLALAGILFAASAATLLAQTTQPTDTTPLAANATTQPAARSAEEIERDLQANGQALGQALGNPEELSDPQKRAAAAPKAVPLLKQMLGYLDELAVAQPAFKGQLAQANPQLLALLSVLGDKESTDKLGAMSQSKDPDEALVAQGAQLMASWLLAGKDVSAQTKVVDNLEKLDNAHPDSVHLTQLTAAFGHSAASPELKTRLDALMTNTMNNPMVDEIKQQMTAEAKLKQVENKPLEIKGKTVDGKDFTTADWKGKVILVDFWATWCGPCRAELPRVKKLYSDYHDKGLEILGVSNDFDSKELTDFTAKEAMLWPELFDADAAAKQSWNPITTGFGINGIPTMFLIDKKGVVRTVEAREKMEDLIPKMLAE